MTNPRLIIPTLVAVLLGGIAHAGEFSLGSARMLAENTAQAGVDVTVTFTDRGHALREMAEGGDAATHNTRELRGADVVTPDSSDSHAAANAPASKPTEPAPPSADSPHGVSISPPTAIKRPSYRWQSLVPGTIK
jgi:hypothetical protein